MASDSKGYYKILGLNPGASIDEVKKVYRKKQAEMHPSGPARKVMRESAAYKALSEEERTKKEKELDDQVSLVNQAFNVLSVPKKKEEYDSGTGEFAEMPEGFGGFGGFADIFSHFAGGGRRRGEKQMYKVKDTEIEVKINLKEAFVGKVNKYKVKTRKVCTACKGKGAKEVCKCSKCGGSGVVYIRKSLGIMVTQQEAACPDCDGAGEKPMGPLCTECKGEKINITPVILELRIPAGVEDGQTIKFNGMGNQMPDCVPGDVVFKFTITPYNNFTRVDQHLIGSVKIDWLTAMCGGVCYFDHIDGRKLSVTVQPFKELGTLICVPSEGFRGQNGRGDLFLKPQLVSNTRYSRDALENVIRPAITKPTGEFHNVNGIFEEMPERRHAQDDSQSNADPHDIFSSFRWF